VWTDRHRDRRRHKQYPLAAFKQVTITVDALVSVSPIAGWINTSKLTQNCTNESHVHVLLLVGIVSERLLRNKQDIFKDNLELYKSREIYKCAFYTVSQKNKTLNSCP